MAEILSERAAWREKQAVRYGRRLDDMEKKRIYTHTSTSRSREYKPITPEQLYNFDQIAILGQHTLDIVSLFTTTDTSRDFGEAETLGFYIPEVSRASLREKLDTKSAVHDIITTLAERPGGAEALNG